MVITMLNIFYLESLLWGCPFYFKLYYLLKIFNKITVNINTIFYVSSSLKGMFRL